jgi:hypothetical protein
VAVVAAQTLGGQNVDPNAIKPSQHATVSQMVAHTNITIVYNRPTARGRQLFGKLVPWGLPWCPGADSATTITVSRDVRVNDATLRAGTYSVWAIPDSARWTIIFSRAAPVFHVPYPEGKDALRISATPRAGPHMETLAFYFPAVDSTRAELDLHWGETIVPIVVDAP